MPLTPADVAGTAYVRFPPQWRHVLVPLRPAGAAALATTLYTASRPRPLLAQHAAWLLARAGAARLLPGTPEQWTPPVPADLWARLWQEWDALLGGVEGLAVYERPQASRTGVLLALWRPGRALVVRLREGPSTLGAEAAAARAVAELAVRTYAVPRVRGEGSDSGWSWVASEAMGTRPHRPVLALPDGLLADVARTVGAALPRPPGTPGHWQPAHGDLTPWNLRTSGRTRWLIDWEDAGWAPPHADAVYFTACAATLGAPAVWPATRDERAEAVAHWHDRVSARSSSDTDADLQRRLLSLLAEAGD